MPLRERLRRFPFRSSWTMLVPTTCLSLLLLGVGVVAAWQLDRIQASVSQTVALNVSSMRASEELEIALRELRTRINQYLLTKDRRFLSELPERRQQVNKWLQESRRLATTKTEQDQVSRIVADYQRLSGDFDRLQELAADSDNDAELELLGRSLALDEMRGMLSAAHEYLDFNENMITHSSEQHQKLTGRLVPTLSLLGICGAVAGVLMGFAIARSVRQRVVECNVPIRDVAGKLDEVLGPLTISGAIDLDDFEPVLRQIAERVQHVVRRLQDSERETLRAEQLAAVGQLAAGMAHELRNPLTSMKVLVQSSLLGDRPVLDGRDLDILEEEIDRMAELIESFLEYARPPKLEKRVVDVTDLCQQAVSLILPRAVQKKLNVLTRLRPSLLMRADARQLRQLLLNLLENALDATNEGALLWIEAHQLNQSPATITMAPWDTTEETSSSDTAEIVIPRFVTSASPITPVGHSTTSATPLTHENQDSDTTEIDQEESDPQTGIHILIADSGCGIPTELGDRIFQPFVSTKETGLGLGLSICRRIVQTHGGQIEASNLEGGGTAFSVWLPLGDNIHADVEAIHTSAQDKSAGTRSNDGLPSRS